MKRSNPSRRAGSNPPNRVAVCVLAGGSSSRMGRDKARLRLGRHTMLGVVRATAKTLKLPVRVLRRDLVPRCGPLGGVYTALKTARSDIVLFLSCDMPFVTAAWLRKLLGELGEGASGVFTVLDGLSGFPFAVRAGGLPIVEQQLACGEYSLQSFARVLQAKRLAPTPRERRRLTNVNTPADLLRARQRATTPRGAPVHALLRRPRKTPQSSKDRTRRRPRR